MRASTACREGRKFDGVLAYAFAKRAQVYVTEQWAAKLSPLGICVNSMHPGARPPPRRRSPRPSSRHDPLPRVVRHAWGAKEYSGIPRTPEG